MKHMTYLFCYIVNFEMRCHTKGTLKKLSTRPQQPHQHVQHVSTWVLTPSTSAYSLLTTLSHLKGKLR